MLKINLGGQKARSRFPKDWVIVDYAVKADYQLDFNKDKLPFRDESVDAIYTSHTLEHIYPDALKALLSETYRVLKPNGKIRIVVPDIDIAIKAYVEGNTQLLKDKDNPTKVPFLPKFPICYLQSWFTSYSVKDGRRLLGGHKMAFTKPLLSWFIQLAGYNYHEFLSYNNCDPIFLKCDFPRYRKTSIYMEATKVDDPVE